MLSPPLRSWAQREGDIASLRQVGLSDTQNCEYIELSIETMKTLTLDLSGIYTAVTPLSVQAWEEKSNQ